MGTTASTVSGAIAEHDAELGTITASAMGTTASTVSGAIRELEEELDSLLTFVSDTNLDAETIGDAIDEVNSRVPNVYNAAGTLLNP